MKHEIVYVSRNSIKVVFKRGKQNQKVTYVYTHSLLALRIFENINAVKWVRVPVNILIRQMLKRLERLSCIGDMIQRGS